MNTFERAALLAAFVSVPWLAFGEDTLGDETGADTDEIVVVGRSVSTSAIQVEVDRELLVDTATVLKDIPGANVNMNGAITGIAQYRGMFGDRVTIDVDGLCIIAGGPNAMDSPLSYASPMITEQLVVERGVASLSSAPESVGGYLDARLSRGDFSTGDARLSGLLGTRYSDNGGISTTAGRLTLASDSHRVAIVAELDEGNSLRSPQGEIRPTQLDRKRYDLSYAFNGRRASGLFYTGKLDTNETGTPALPMDIRYIDTGLYGAHLNLVASDTTTIEAKLAYNDVRHLMDNFGLRQAPGDMMRYRQNLTNGKGWQYSIATVFAFDDSGLRVGIDGIAAEHDSTITNPNSSMLRIDNFVAIERDLSSVFAEWTRERDERDLELGIRFKRVDTNAGQVGAAGLVGNMGSNVQILADNFNAATRDLQWDSVDVVAKYGWQVDNDNEWRVEIGSKTRAPSYQELYLWLPLQATGGLADGRTYIGNLGLKEERSNEIVVGFTTHAGRVSLAPQVFFRKVDDYIQGTPSSNGVANMVATMMSGNPALEWNNVDAEIWGADLAWKVDLTERLFLDGIATAVRGRRTDVADNLYRLAPFNGSVGLTWAADTWSLKTEVVAYAKQNKVSSYNNERATPGYELVNVAFTWQALDGLRIETRVDNLLDETYQDHVAGINRAAGSGVPVGERLYGAERSLSVGVIYSF